MKSLANHCKAPLCPFRRILLLASISCVVAHGQTANIDTNAAGKGLLTDYAENGYSLSKVIPLAQLPARILFNKGAISLVPDPTDRTGKSRSGYADPYMVVYLINDTDEPIPRIIGGLHKVISQINIGDHWFYRESIRIECATTPPPKDLPAHCALALGGLSDLRGDIDGKIRYTFNTPNRIVTSEPQRGRYKMSELLDTIQEGPWYTDLDSGALNGLLKNQWDGSSSAKNLEEFCALLELVRHHQIVLQERSIILNWVLERTTKHDATSEQEKAIKRIQSLLIKPWMIDNDKQSLLDRSIAALEAKPSKVYGTPEKCRACVWRFLAYNNSLDHTTTLTNDDNISIYRESITKLVSLARKASQDSNDPEAADAAIRFLGSFLITDEMFPTHEFFKFLESDRPQRVHAGLFGLYTRKRLRDAIPWLLERAKKNDPNLAEYYMQIQFHLDGEMNEQEKSVLIHLIKTQTWKTLQKINEFNRARFFVKLPEECAEVLRNLLNAQLTAGRKKWWAANTERIQREQPTSDHYVESYPLSEAIILLDTLNDPTDVPLLKSFLDHPAASIVRDSNENSTLHFTARSVAKHCLERRNIVVPVSVVTQIDLKPNKSNLDLKKNFIRLMLTHDMVIMGVCLTALTGGCFALRHLRTRRHLQTP